MENRPKPQSWSKMQHRGRNFDLLLHPEPKSAHPHGRREPNGPRHGRKLNAGTLWEQRRMRCPGRCGADGHSPSGPAARASTCNLPCPCSRLTGPQTLTACPEPCTGEMGTSFPLSWVAPFIIKYPVLSTGLLLSAVCSASCREPTLSVCNSVFCWPLTSMILVIKTELVNNRVP